MIEQGYRSIRVAKERSGYGDGGVTLGWFTGMENDDPTIGSGQEGDFQLN